VNVHHGDESKTPRMTKSTLPATPNAKVVFMTLPSALLQEQPAVVLCWRGLKSLEC
jgi:hypothetical protein